MVAITLCLSVAALLISASVLPSDGGPARKPYRSPPRHPRLKMKSPGPLPLKVPPPPGAFHYLLSPGDLLHYFGASNKHEVPEYTITSPSHVRGNRHRRDVDSKKDKLEYVLTAFGKTYELILDHNNNLIAPGCVVEQITNGSKQLIPCVKMTPDIADGDCFYTGSSKSHKGSAVAVSVCSGFQGVISIPEEDHDLVIKPIKDHHVNRVKRNANGNNLHVVFKRSSQGRLCEGTGDAENTLNNELKPVKVHSSRKRSTNELYMELMLVADKTLHQYHGADLRNFLLTITNVAAARFMDQSLGQSLHLSVVKIKILEDDQPGLEIVEDARYGLKSFCEWQEKDNPATDTDPLHYDAAVLFTRVDLQYGSSGSSSVGLANAGGVCTASSRCAYVEDTGVDTGLTLAHELGHTLGMTHDGSQNTCGDQKNIMSSSGVAGPDSLKWSSCSRDAFNVFISSGRASCLEDVPTHQEELPKDLPGVIYDPDDQCRLWVGTHYYNHTDPCGQLWCVDPENPQGIIKASSSMMDGSMCGPRKYCINAQCVDIGANGPQPVDGGWSAWPAAWSECSRTCGGGIRTKVRTCDNPKPRLGGKPCEGESTKTNLCNVKSCNSSESKFKEDQCQATKNQPINGQLFDWIPWEQRGSQQCYLLCKSQPGNKISRRYLEGSQNYRDGTSCVGDKNSDFYKCVKGACQPHSCDGHSDSRYKFDRCGVCGGSNNTCTSRKGAKTQGEPQKWSTIAKFTRGTTGIQLRNKNRLAKMTLFVNGKQIINENPSMPSPSQIYSSEGVTIAYQKGDTSEDESIEVIGPLTEDVEAQVFTFFADQRFQPNVSFEYNVPIVMDRSHEWRTIQGNCNVECGGGQYEVDIKCYQISNNEVVEDRFCNIFDKPDSLSGACNPQPCTPEWRVGDWEACDKSCGSGSQKRLLDCVQKANGAYSLVSADQCPVDKKPVDTRVCNVAACDAQWETSSWSQCSMTCGRGIQTKEVKCMSGPNEVPESNCKDPKPENRQACVEKVCDTNAADGECKDIIQDCAGYDINMCSEYGDWAKANCKVTCSFCSPTTTQSSVIVCEDKSNDCSAYGTSVCSGEYAEWAAENCAKFCGKCTSEAETTVAASSECVDKSTDCAGYGQGVCTGEYAQWAAENCAYHCGHCASKSQQMAVVSCANVSPDCAGYGASICHGEYADWAKENCAQFCGFCSAATTASSSSATLCADVSTDCAGYGASVCQGEYADWAKLNCAKFCGKCDSNVQVSTQLVAQDTCVDASNDCAGYGSSVCQGEYADWAKLNCAKFCSVCGNSAQDSAQTASQSSCTDLSPDCAGYGVSVCTGEYADWAKINCANYCHSCPSEGSTGVNCADKLSDCTAYGKDVCTNEYATWARENCPKMCGFC